MKQRSITVSDDKIIELFEQDITLHDASVLLGLTTVTLWRRLKKLNLKWSDKSHTAKDAYALYDILDGKYPQYQTFKLKKRLIREGVKQNVCEICGIDSWNDKPLTMQLDHIDGNPHNHVLDNLRLVCPNCHAQTDTYCGKNKN
jgi:hypothetical protein